MKECWRPRFRLAPVLAVLEGVVPAEARPGWGKQDGKDGQGAWRVLLVRAVRSLVSVTQVLSKEELGPTAGVNLGSSAYLRLPKTGNGGRRRLINIVCLGGVSSMKGDEPQL